MAKFYVINRVRDLKNKVHPVNLIETATPVHTLRHFGRQYGHSNLLIKREDQTDQIYGGNKVRNLEFVLGEALYQKQNQVSTLIPYGSNFTGALAAHSKKLGILPKLSQFVVQRNPQIEAHVRFGLSHGAKMRTFEGTAALPMAIVHATYERLQRQSFYIPPGASSVLGAIGHANAFLEMIQQTRATPPDRVIVGAGTCGTIAGLIVGAHLSGENTRVTGVRCAEPIVCNSRRIARLANLTFDFLGVNKKISVQDVELRESRENKGYALSDSQAKFSMDEFFHLEGISLDTTYTSKVVTYLREALSTKQFMNETVMYWHTFSPAAMKIAEVV